MRRTVLAATFTVAALLATIVTSAAAPRGAADFTYHGTQPGLQQSMERADECLACHYGDDVDRRTMPFGTWGGAMMSHATRDPLFWSALDIANNDVPGVGDYCLRCHAPEGWFDGRVAKTGGTTIVDGTDGCMLAGDHDDRDTFKSDFGGVTCHLCHRQRERGPLGEIARRESGNLWIDDSESCNGFNGPCRTGPYRYPDGDIYQPPHGTAYDPFIKRGEFCGTCHDVTTPITAEGPLKLLVLNNGTVTDVPFPIERTFSEWRASNYADKIFVDGFAFEEPRTDEARFGATCQSCHMPKSDEPLARACALEAPGSRAGNLPQHLFVGANAWVLGLVRDLYAGPTGIDRVAEINRSIELVRVMLTQRSATIGVTLQSFAGPGNPLNARVRVTNLAGHKLPTGYGEGRRMWLDVEARDGNGQLVWRSGAYDDATGVLTRDAQARVYEIRHGIWNDATDECEIEDAGGVEHFHFALNNCIASDNRIPPLGFRGGANVEIAPVPATEYPETAPGSGVLVNYDDTDYVIPIPPGTATPIRVTATLRHQVASKEYIEFLRNQAIEHDFPSEDEMCADNRPGGLDTGPQDKSRGQFMYDLWLANGRSPPEAMVSAQAQTP